MPVSRKRKKKRSGKAGRPASSGKTFPLSDPAERSTAGPLDERIARLGHLSGGLGQLGFLDELFEHRRRIDAHRMRIAAPVAARIVAELIELARELPDADLEDTLCVRFGQQMYKWDNGDVPEDMVGPEQLLVALGDAAAEAVRTAVADSAGWRDPLRVLIGLSRIAHSPLREHIEELIEGVRSTPGGQVLPAIPSGPTLTGPVLWTRDGYGSRFGVLAAFSVGDEPQRWYLWDIDACGREPATVHGSYYPTPDEGFSEWRAAVGDSAGGAALAPLDDPALLVELLPQPEGLTRWGGEGPELFAEYHRCRRLAMEVIATLDPPGPRPKADKTVARAAKEFLTWLREHRPDTMLERASDEDGPILIEELVSELADSWCAKGADAIYYTCSPHRLAQLVPHIRDFFKAEFAEHVIALLPLWCSWLAERTGTPPELAELCQPYATGDQNAGPLAVAEPNWYQRVRE